MIEEVGALLPSGNGHDVRHVERVLCLAKKFATAEGADLRIVELACLLHDVDDYKIFGELSEKNLTNANRILEKFCIDRTTKTEVLEIIQTVGFSKRLSGIPPKTLEGQVVSDADLCDAIGARGIIRTHEYNTARGIPFFDKTIPPIRKNVSPELYRNASLEHAVQHFFDKMLFVPSILQTKSGIEEGGKRLQIMISFLEELFREENAEDWRKFLSDTIDGLSGFEKNKSRQKY